jgi:hypothetical protein
MTRPLCQLLDKERDTVGALGDATEDLWRQRPAFNGWLLSARLRSSSRCRACGRSCLKAVTVRRRLELQSDGGDPARISRACGVAQPSKSQISRNLHNGTMAYSS